MAKSKEKVPPKNENNNLNSKYSRDSFGRKFSATGPVRGNGNKREKEFNLNFNKTTDFSRTPEYKRRNWSKSPRNFKKKGRNSEAKSRTKPTPTKKRTLSTFKGSNKMNQIRKTRTQLLREEKLRKEREATVRQEKLIKMNKERYENGRKEWDNNFAIRKNSGQIYSMCGDGYKARKDSIATRVRGKKRGTRNSSSKR